MDSLGFPSLLVGRTASLGMHAETVARKMLQPSGLLKISTRNVGSSRGLPASWSQSRSRSWVPWQAPHLADSLAGEWTPLWNAGEAICDHGSEVLPLPLEMGPAQVQVESFISLLLALQGGGGRNEISSEIMRIMTGNCGGNEGQEQFSGFHLIGTLTAEVGLDLSWDFINN